MYRFLKLGRVALSVARLTQEPKVPGSIPGRGSGKVLGKFSVPGRPSGNSKARAYCTYSRFERVVWTFFLASIFSSPSLEDGQI